MWLNWTVKLQTTPPPPLPHFYINPPTLFSEHSTKSSNEYFMPLLLFQITVNGQLNAQGITFKIQYWEDHLFIKQREVLLMNKIEIITVAWYYTSKVFSHFFPDSVMQKLSASIEKCKLHCSFTLLLYKTAFL